MEAKCRTPSSVPQRCGTSSQQARPCLLLSPRTSVVAYLNFSNMYCTIQHSLIQHIMAVQGFSKRDIQLVRNLYAGTASAVRLPTGTSAWIENRSGVMQGAPESCPIANLVVGALVRFLHSTPRVGFINHRGCREFVLGYADGPGLCLLANSTEEMAALRLLAQVELFCSRTGLELNVVKTVVQGLDYATGQDLRPQVSFEGQRVPCLPARTPFK